MLNVIRGVIDDDVSCSDYVNKRLILSRGSLAHLKLTKIGYKYDAHISLDAEGVLMISVPHYGIR